MKPQTRRSAEVRQKEIVQAVLALAADNSPDAITTQAVANRLGLTQGAVFRHFASREAIWLAVVDWLEESLGTAIAAATEADQPVETLRRIFAAHIDFISRHPSAPRLIFNELQKPADNPIKQRVQGLLDRYRQRLTGLLVQAKRLGLVDAQLDEAAASTLFVGALQGLVVQIL